MSDTWASPAWCKEPWSVEIDFDCFAEDEPMAVVLDAEQGDDTGEHNVLIVMEAAQAREMAAALIRHADNADANNARIAASPPSGSS